MRVSKREKKKKKPRKLEKNAIAEKQEPVRRSVIFCVRTAF